MRAELIVALGVFLAWLGMYSIGDMVPRINRPRIFRGKWGEGAFGGMALSVAIFSVSMLVWSFLHIAWYINVPILIGALVVSILAVKFLPIIFVDSVLAPITAAFGLAILHYIAWFSPS